MNKRILERHKTALFFFLGSYLLSLSGYVYADADVNFFKTQSSWADRFRYKGVSVTPGKEGVGFIGDERDQFQYQGAAARYFREPDVHEDNKEDLYQPPPPVSILLTTLRDSRETLELEMDQVAELRADGLKRYVATDEDRVDFYEVDSRTLQIKGTKFGNTFIHIWDENGRTTIPLRVIPRQLLQEYADRQLVKSEESQSFTVEYSETRSTFYTGDNFEELAQTSLSYNQQFVVKGDSPYGHLTGAGSLRRGTDKAELAAATLELADGHIGQFSDFDLTVGDTAVDPALLVLPSYRFRGFHLDYGKSQESGRLNLFFGRELSSIFGTLISTQQTTSDSFMGGFYYDYKPADWIDWRFGYFAASGQDRSDDLNKHGIEIKQKYKISDNLNITSRLGYNEEQIAFDMDVNFQIGRWRGRVSYRDIPENFYSMVGSASGRGEQGVRFNIAMPIYDSLSLDYAAHVYRDRLNFFQNEYDRFNVSQTLRGNYQVNENSSLSFKVEDNEETALPSQNRSESYEVGYRLRSAVGSHPVNYSVRLRHQDSEPLNSPDAFYRRQSLILGLNTPLWWGFDFAYTYNVSLLEETVIRSISHPRISSYSLTRNERIPETPITTDFSIRYVDEEETESNRSFLTGEDRLEISGKLTYEIKDLELYVEGRYDSYRGENSVNEASAEAELITGVRYLYDTGIRWEPQMSVSGVIFDDRNKDGIRQTDEPPMSGVAVLSGDKKSVSDQNGVYHLPSIYGNKITVAVDSKTLPHGYAGSTSLIRTIENEGRSVESDFGLVAMSSLSGNIYNDLNGNGEFDRGEPGVEGVKIQIDKGKYSTSTRADGAFRFSNIEIGKHDVSLDVRSLPLGYLPFRKFKHSVELQKGDRLNMSFPVVAQRTLSGRVYKDINKNGRFDSDDEPVSGAKVLFGTFSMLSDDEGYYLLENIPPGQRNLTVHPNSVPGLQVEFSQDISFSDKPKQESVNIPLNPSES